MLDTATIALHIFPLARSQWQRSYTPQCISISSYVIVTILAVRAITIFEELEWVWLLTASKLMDFPMKQYSLSWNKSLARFLYLTFSVCWGRCNQARILCMVYNHEMHGKFKVADIYERIGMCPMCQSIYLVAHNYNSRLTLSCTQNVS